MAGFIGSPNIVTDGLVFLVDASNNDSYPGSGTVFNNLADSSNNFTINGSPTFNTSPDRFTFSSNQTTKYFEKSSYSFPLNDMSVSIWVRFGSTTAQMATVSYATTSSDNDSLMFVSNGDLRFYGPATTSSWDTGWNVVNTTSWFNIVRTRIKSTGTEAAYINGSLVSTSTWQSNQSPGSSGTLIFGQEQDSVGGGFSASQCFYGDFGMLKIYNKSLTSDEVLQNYNSIKSRFNL